MPQANTTKELILYKSMHLFANDGYESVSMKMIARESGIQAASIYNHYKSKEEILEHIYQYFLDHQNICRPTEAEYLPILKSGTATEIMDIFNYPMPDEEDSEPVLFDTIRIVWSRIFTDATAREMYKREVVDEAYRYVREVLLKGIELGRLKIAEEDIHTFAAIVLATRNYVASSLPIDPDEEKWRKMGTSMIGMLSKLVEVNPPLV